MQAASLIAPPRRDDFLRHLAAQLEDAHKPSDARLTLVLCDRLGRRVLKTESKIHSFLVQIVERQQPLSSVLSASLLGREN